MNVSVFNGTFSSGAHLQQTFPIIYSFFGLLAICSNLFTLCVLISERRLLKKSAIVVGVTVSHFLCGLAIGITGLFRVIHASNLNSPIDSWDCIRLGFAILFPLTFQSMAAMLLLVGIERVLATVAYNWFYINWTPRRAWISVFVAYSYVAVPTAIALRAAWKMRPKSATLSCLLPSVFGMYPLIWNSGTAVSAGVAAVVLTMISYRFGVTRIAKLPLISGERGRLSKQLRLTLAMMTVSCLDFLLVIVPNLIVCLTWTKIIVIRIDTLSIANILYGVNACFTVFSLLAFHSEFRRAAIRLVMFQKQSMTAIAPNNAPA